MNKILEALKQVERIEDQTLIGLGRVSRNVALAKKLLEAARAEDLGPETNALLDELIVVADKLNQVVGAR